LKFRFLPDIGGAYCFVIFVIMVLFAGKRALLDGDTLWHIKFGTLMIERGEIITRDIFSHTVPGKPWTSHEWLSEIIMGAVHNLAGLPGVVIFYFLIAALTFWILFLIARHCGAGEWLSIFAVSVAMVLSMTHLLARPHIFSWLFGVITLYILQKGGRKLFLLPLLMIPWVNLHGGFALGLALQGLFLLGSLLERWPASPHPKWKAAISNHRIPMAVLLLSVLATGVNPFGYELLLFPFQVSKGVFSSSIGEWLPPNFQQLWFFRLYILLIIFLLFFNGPRISWTSRLFALFFLNAALTHSRHVSIAGLFLTPFLVEAMRPWAQQLAQRRRTKGSQPELSLSRVSGPVATALLGFGMLAASAGQWPLWEKLSSTLIPLPDKFTVGAVSYLKEHPPRGNLYNQDEWGDYLIYAMDPPPRLFVDGRLDMYGERILEDYLKIRDIKEGVEEVLREYEIDWVLFPPSPLTRYLKAKREWKEAYRDDQAVILLRTSEAAP
jgi:hypothetical protein